ncbi:MAG: MFS transporter [Spirochaetaceae bacterium]|nr:MFS transporter [Myxococcales bacterium]MCB9722513.1 MFS transporter [Spirochaetaceae bacterium]HPG28549.1 MFS transporter [Myxococcota bacterium]
MAGDDARGDSRGLLVLFSVIVVDLIGFGIVVPILPFWAERFGADGTHLGWIVACHAGMQFLFAPVWGRLSDRIGRRPVMLLTIAGTAIALGLLGFADSLPQIYLARLLSGAFGANISVATAYLTDVTEEADRTRWMGMIGASFAVGFTLGPPIGGALARLGHGTPMFVAAGMAAANLVWAALRLREPARHAGHETTRPLSRLAVLREPGVGRLCFIYFLFSVAVTQLETVFAFFMAHRFGYDELGVGLVMLGMAIVMGGIQGGGMKRLSARFRERRLVLGGLGLMTIAFATLPVPSTVAWLLVPLAIAAVGRGLAQPPMMSLVSLNAEERTRGVVLGVFQSSASAARVVGPILAGALYDAGDALPFLAAAVLVASAGLVALGVRDARETGGAVATAPPLL